MSQDDRSHRAGLSLLDEGIANKLRLVETNVGYLIREQFKEPEQSLNRNVLLLSVLSLSQSKALQPACQSSIVVPVLTTPVQSLLVIPYSQPEERLNVLVARASYSVNCSPGQTGQLDQFLFSPRPTNQQFFFCLASAAVAVTLFLWVGSQAKLGPDDTAPPLLATPPTSHRPMVSAGNTQLTSYRQQSPAPIDPKKQVQVTQQTTARSTTGTQPIRASLPAKLRAIAPVVPVPSRIRPERVYVPYQLPSSQQQAASQPQAVYKASVSSPTSPASSNRASTSTHTLVGVLEFGDRSAALVDANHVTRRISIGETLTPDGWKLAKVVGQKVVLQREGKLRSIYVGQTF